MARNAANARRMHPIINNIFPAQQMLLVGNGNPDTAAVASRSLEKGVI